MASYQGNISTRNIFIIVKATSSLENPQEVVEEAGEDRPEVESWQSLYFREVEQLLYEMSSIPALFLSKD